MILTEGLRKFDLPWRDISTMYDMVNTTGLASTHQRVSTMAELSMILETLVFSKKDDSIGNVYSYDDRFLDVIAKEHFDKVMSGDVCIMLYDEPSNCLKTVTLMEAAGRELTPQEDLRKMFLNGEFCSPNCNGGTGNG